MQLSLAACEVTYESSSVCGDLPDSSQSLGRCWCRVQWGKAEAEIVISVRKIYSAREHEVSYYNVILFGLFNGLNVVGGMHLN